MFNKKNNNNNILKIYKTSNSSNMRQTKTRVFPQINLKYRIDKIPILIAITTNKFKDIDSYNNHNNKYSNNNRNNNNHK